MAFNPHEHLKQNISAIDIALNYKEGDLLSNSDILSLLNYSGFGGIKTILLGKGTVEQWKESKATASDLRMYDDIQRLHDLLLNHFGQDRYRQVISSLKSSVLTAFYTPSFVPKSLYQAMQVAGLYPRSLYEPSAGTGVFLRTALEQFPELERITAVEKDLLTGKILKSIAGSWDVNHTIHIAGFEEAPASDHGKYDLIASNIPFGDFSVYDPALPTSITCRIHNYFFAKAIEKIADGGMIAFLTADGFLNSPGNFSARDYLFNRADFVSLVVMPDNLMKDIANVEVGIHLLIVQKNTGKQALSDEEQQLLTTVQEENEFGNYDLNAFIQQHPQCILGEVSVGKDQFGNASMAVWQDGPIDGIQNSLRDLLIDDLRNRMDRPRFRTIRIDTPSQQGGKEKFTFNKVPQPVLTQQSYQLGFFDTAPTVTTNKATPYLSDVDKRYVQMATARVVSTLRTTEQPLHDSIVLLSAQATGSRQLVFRLCSNVEQLSFERSWANSVEITRRLQELSNRLKSFDHQFVYDGDLTMKDAFRLEYTTAGILSSALKPFYKTGTLIIHQGKPGVIGAVMEQGGMFAFEPFVMTEGRTDFFQQYIALRDKYLETGDDPHLTEGQRLVLQQHYKDFVGQYGQLNLPGNRRLILNDVAFGNTVLSSMERRDGPVFVPADILTQSLQPEKVVFTTDHPSEALARSLNDYGSVDMGFIASALSVSQQEAIERLQDHILLNPTTFEWETKDHFLSGNVVAKLSEAESILAQQPENEHLRASVQALQDVQPAIIPFELLDFNFGERWIPLNYYERFVTELFGTPTRVSFMRTIDKFAVKPHAMNAQVTSEYAVKLKTGDTYNGHLLMEHALENTAPFFTYEVDVAGQKVRVPDSDAIQIAHEKIEKIRTRFIDWLSLLPEREKGELEKMYNDLFNCYVARTYDGSHQLFPGLDLKKLDIPAVYKSQMDATWRIIQNRGGIIDHEVGLGKTLIMVLAANEMKRLKICHKPTILALKANVDQIAQTYRQAFPNAKILAPDEKDFEPANRMRLFHEFKNNNWDCIIMTHDQFGRIPQSLEIQQRTLQNELDDLERDLKTYKDLGGEIDKRLLRGLEIRRQNLTSKLKSIATAIDSHKDQGITFESIGIDHLFVDESHKFKNLTYTTRHDRVAGLGNKEGSQRALNMLFAIRSLQERFGSDLCATFLSGTPISNSLTELYLLFKYLRPKALERQMIENFDAWAAVYARKTTDFEFSITNAIIAKQRFRHFIKVPELANFYAEITDYRTAAGIKLDKPVMREELVHLPPTEDQKDFIEKLVRFAQNGDATLLGRRRLTPQEDKGRMLIATNYAKKMSLDMRLINPAYKDDPGNKINACCSRLVDWYHKSAEYRGTQIVFCDLGTPKDHQFSVYHEIKRKLTSVHDIPADQIAFIHDYPTKAAKKQLFRKMNAGEIRVLVGSTDKAGTGVNVQQRIVAMHHLDIPWKPSELEQRNGRGVRTGNWVAKQHFNNEVAVYVYAVERSLDSYRFNLLKNKQVFISQLKNNSLQVRRIDEGAIDEQTGMNFAEYLAILSGDTTLLEKSRIEKKIASLETLKSAFLRESYHNRQTITYQSRLKDLTAEKLEKYQKDFDSYHRALTHQKDGTKDNPIALPFCKSVDPIDMGNYLIDLYKSWNKPGIHCIGELYGFELCVSSHKKIIKNLEGKVIEEPIINELFARSNFTNLEYHYNDGEPNLDNPKLALRHFLNGIDRVDSLLIKEQKELERLLDNLEVLQKVVDKPFDRETELVGLREDHKNLERQLSITIQKNKMQQVGEVDTVALAAESAETGEGTEDQLEMDNEINEDLEEMENEISSKVVSKGPTNGNLKGMRRKGGSSRRFRP